MKDFECPCKECINLCWKNPGWFGSTDEVIKASKLLGMSLVDFALEYLIREWWAGDDDVSIPAPRRNFERGKPEIIKIYKYWEKEKSANFKGIWNREIIANGKGFRRATWGHNLMSGWACIFLDENGKCRIHKSKPQECRESFGCKKGNFKGREHIKNYWKEHQDFIKLLLFKE